MKKSRIAPNPLPVVLLSALYLLLPGTALAIDTTVNDLISRGPDLSVSVGHTVLPTPVVLACIVLLVAVLLILLHGSVSWHFWVYYLGIGFLISAFFGLWLPVFFIGIPLFAFWRRRIVLTRLFLTTIVVPPPVQVQNTYFTEQPRPQVNVILINPPQQPPVVPPAPTPLDYDTQPYDEFYENPPPPPRLEYEGGEDQDVRIPEYDDWELR